MKRIMFFLIVGLYVPILCLAQKDDRKYRSFANQLILKKSFKENPDYLKNEIQSELQISDFIQAPAIKDFTLPVIFHVISNPSQKVPDEAQISAQLDKVNALFSNVVNTEFPKDKLPNDLVGKYYENGIETQIQFCNPKSILGLSGIRYYETKNEFWSVSNDMKDLEKGGIEAVDPMHYINIWIVDFKENTAGFAQMPGIGKLQNDGIVIDINFFGDADGMAFEHYQGGKTLAHLLGTYLGLYELWDDDNTCKDDNVEDTPIHNAPNYDVSTVINHRHITICPDNFIQMYMNIMDNTDDYLLTLFTKGQKSRMQATLSDTGARAVLGSGKISCFGKPNGKVQFISQKNSLDVFPNPLTNLLNISINSQNEGPASLSIINSLGMNIFEQQYELVKGTQIFTIENINWPIGAYFLKVQFEDKTFLTKTLTIKN